MGKVGISVQFSDCANLDFSYLIRYHEIEETVFVGFGQKTAPYRPLFGSMLSAAKEAEALTLSRSKEALGEKQSTEGGGRGSN